MIVRMTQFFIAGAALNFSLTVIGAAADGIEPSAGEGVNLS